MLCNYRNNNLIIQKTNTSCINKKFIHPKLLRIRTSKQIIPHLRITIYISK